MSWIDGVTEIINNIIKWIMRDTDPDTIKKRIILKYKKELERKKKELSKVENDIKEAVVEDDGKASVLLVYRKKLESEITNIEKTLKEFEK